MKKYLLLVLSIFTFLAFNLDVHASVETYERTKDNNYNVNKKWKITDKNLSNVTKTYSVDADVKIYDFSEVLTEDEYDLLKEKIDKFVKKTDMDMVILIDDVAYTNDSYNETVAADFYDYNDFGIDFEHYSGILLFRNTYVNDPYFNIYTFGEAQLYFDYDRLESVLDDIYPSLKTHSYLDGFGTFIDRISNYYDKGIPNSMKYYHIGDMGELVKEYRPPYVVAFGIAVVVSGIIVLIFVFKNKMVQKATKASEYLDKSSIVFTKEVDSFRNSVTTHYTVSSSSGSGGGSSFGSSGGGHSSGGGRHG